MWPFQKRKSDADRVIEIMDQAVSFACEKWLYFSQTLIFNQNVPLRDRIAAFLVPVSEGLKNKFEPLRRAPDPVILLIVAKGVEASRTHSRNEIENALGAPLPE